LNLLFRADGARPGNATDRTIVQLLLERDRDGMPSEVVLRDGSRLLIFNISWGFDRSVRSAQITTNINPSIGGAPVEMFWAEAVVAINDAETGAPLLAIA
jgi:hypothetical protein